MSKLCNAKILQIYSNEDTNKLINATWSHSIYVPVCTIFSETQNTVCTNNYILLQFTKEMNTRGSTTPFTPFHTNLQRFD